MPPLSPEEFETLWKTASEAPAVQQVAVNPIKIDVSLSSALDQYAKIAGQALTQRRLNEVDHDALVTAINGLKAVLARVNEEELLAPTLADQAKKFEQQIQDRVASLISMVRR
jgi:hypothetical protein